MSSILGSFFGGNRCGEVAGAYNSTSLLFFFLLLVILFCNCGFWDEDSDSLLFFFLLLVVLFCNNCGFGRFGPDVVGEEASPC